MLNEKTRNEFPRYVPLWRNPRFTSFTTGHSITMDSLEEKPESGHVRICTCVYVYNPRFSDTPLPPPPPFFKKNEIVIWFCLRSKYMHINFELNVAFVWIRWSIKLNIYITGTHCFLYMEPHQDQEWRDLHVLFFNRELNLDIQESHLYTIRFFHRFQPTQIIWRNHLSDYFAREKGIYIYK